MKSTYLVLLLLLGFSLFYSLNANAQHYPDRASGDTVHYPYWFEMIQDTSADFHATVSAFEKYWAGRTDHKGNGWKVFKRWEYIHQDMVMSNGKLPGPTMMLAELERYNATHTMLSPTGNWTLVGPTALPVNSTGQPNGLGRVNGIGFDPVSANTIYVASPSGGLWKTADGGTSWNFLTQSLPTLGVSSVLVHPANTSQILIGTGDRDAGDAPGLGVYISSDGGSTWTASNTGMGSLVVGMLLRHPSDPTIVFAATSSGIFKSINSGSSWTRKSSNTSNYKDIKFKPGDPTVMYATASGSFYRSSNSGETWTQITSGIVTGSRMVIGVSSNLPAVVYLAQTNGTFAGLLKSTDSGLTFTTQSTTPNIMDYACDGSGTSSQASYDLCIAVDPANASILYVGGVNIWKSTDGGVTWGINTHWVGSSWGTTCAPSVHADIHTLDWSPVSGKLYTGCDGGIYYTSTGGTSWTDITSGLSIAQVYKIGQSATNSGMVMNGYQDNGTSFGNGTAFSTVIGGDGMECIIDYSNSNYRYGALYYGDIRRTTGSGYSSIKNTISETGAWVTPYILHATDPNTMFIGYTNVWRTNNVKAASTSSITWTAISSGEGSSCAVLEQSPADVNILYVVRNYVLKRSDNANSATPTWTTCVSPNGTNSITDLAAHPTDANIIYATSGTKVYKSTDKGMTWASISGTLPSININCIAFDKTSTESLYIGTKSGVYVKTADLSDWVSFSNGLPILDIRELEIYYDAANPANNRLKAASYGRGLWQSDLKDNLLVVTPSDQPVTPLSGNTSFSVTTTLAWTASSNQSWCTVTPSGTGNGTITATYAQNNTAVQRTAIITVSAATASPVTVTVTQAAPTLSVTPSSQAVTPTAGSTSFTVTTNSNWVCSSDQVWCTATLSGTGNGTITASYTANTGSSRSAHLTITVPGLTPVSVTVGQAAPTLSVTPSNVNVNENAGTTSFAVTTNTTWTAASNQTWCTVTPSGSGNGTIAVNYTNNIVYTPRVATITITVAGLTPVAVTLSQAAATPPPVLFTMANDVQTSDRTLEFDLFLQDPEPSALFELASVQAGILVNSAIYNGGTLSVSIIPGTSQLIAAQQPASITWVQTLNSIKMAPKSPPGSGNGTIISTVAPGTRVCRLLLTNSVAFAQAHANLAFNFPTSPYPTKVFQYLAGINSLVTCNTNNCYSNCLNPLLNPPTTTVNMTLLLEGLYAGSGAMNAAHDESGLHWGTGIADKITVELHSSSSYSTIIYTANNVDLLTNGTATLGVPNTYSGSYFITVKHRNSISTVTAAPVSFASGPVSYNFTDNATKAYGNNLLQMIDGKYTIFAGDASVDGLIDGTDLSLVDNAASAFLSGYLLTDVNGDGLVDGSDLSIVDNNAAGFVGVALP